jgi:hypothetical protein
MGSETTVAVEHSEVELSKPLWVGEDVHLAGRGKRRLDGPA